MMMLLMMMMTWEAISSEVEGANLNRMRDFDPTKISITKMEEVIATLAAIMPATKTSELC